MKHSHLNTNRWVVPFIAVLGLAFAPLSHAAGTAAPIAQKKPAYKSVDATASTVDSDRAIGGMIGEPIGFTGKFWLDRTTAIDADFGYSFGGFLVLFGDYLWHMDSTEWFESNEFTQRTKLYIGAGAGFRFSSGNSDGDESSMEVFLRAPVGAEWRPVEQPLGVFVEFAPGVKLNPYIGVLFNIDAGLRYYF